MSHDAWPETLYSEHTPAQSLPNATATAANTHGTHNNRIYAETVRNRLREGELSARRTYVGCVLAQRHRGNRVNWVCTQQQNSVIFSDDARFTFIGVMEEFEYTVEEMNYMPTVAYSNDIVLGLTLLFWSGRALHTTLVVIEGNLNAQRYPEEIRAWHIIAQFQNNANMTLFQHDNAKSHTARDTVNFLRANNIAVINDWPAKSPVAQSPA